MRFFKCLTILHSLTSFLKKPIPPAKRVSAAAVLSKNSVIAKLIERLLIHTVHAAHSAGRRGSGGLGLICRPIGQARWGPQDLNCSGEVNSPCAEVLPPAKRSLRRTRGGPWWPTSPILSLRLINTYRPCRPFRRAPGERGARAYLPPGTRWSAPWRPRWPRSPERSG